MRSDAPLSAFRPWLMAIRSTMAFAPDLVGTYQDSECGRGRHCPSPSINGSQSWRGSAGAGRPHRGLERDFFFARPSATSCLVRQPFALGAFDRAIGTLTILDANGGPVAVPEIELGEIS